MTRLPSLLYHHRTRAGDGQSVHVAGMLGAFRALGAGVEEVALVRHGSRNSSPEGGLLSRLRLPRIGMELCERLYSRRGARMLVAAAKNPDLIYERYALHCRAGLVAARRLDIPFFLEVNAPMVEEMQSLGLLHFPRLAARVESELFRSADRIFVVTEVLAGIVESLGAAAERIVVTPNGIDLADFEDARERGRAWREEQIARGALDPEDTLLGFIGYPRAWHRLDLVLGALAGLGDPRLRLLIVGAGPAVEPLRRQAEAMGLAQGRISVTGEVSREEVATLAGALDLAVIPAMNRYASPLKLLDSLAAGTPTLAPRQPNLLETVEDDRHAFLFEPEDQEAFRARLGWVLAHREEARVVGEQGRARIRERDLTWEANARRVVDEWRRLGA
ncbi:MAG: glycosyltransferase family 4 protein [Planctomycetota bacterium]